MARIGTAAPGAHKAPVRVSDITIMRSALGSGSSGPRPPPEAGAAAETLDLRLVRQARVIVHATPTSRDVSAASNTVTRLNLFGHRLC